MNAVLIAVPLVVVLSLLRLNIVASLIFGSVAAALASGMSLPSFSTAFQKGIGQGAVLGLSYAVIGGIAVLISHFGLPQWFADRLIGFAHNHKEKQASPWLLKFVVGAVILLFAIASQNIIPVHIAFIPILIPALLPVLNELHMDRRLVACLLSFGLVTPYIFLPIGFGGIFLNDLLLENIARAGLDSAHHVRVMYAMLFPALGMFIGLVTAMVFFRKPRRYSPHPITTSHTSTKSHPTRYQFAVSIAVVMVTFGVQLFTHSMILGGIAGFLLLSCSGLLNWHKADDLFTQGVKMMGGIGFIMIAASGFSEVLRETGHIDTLVQQVSNLLATKRSLAILLMLFIGLLVTLGIGSSFSTLPILSAIYVPLSMQLGLSPAAVVCLVGAASALGDAGSPASETTLGTTAGLNIDGQHEHMKDTVLPTFVCFNLPLLIMAWLGVEYFL